MASEVSSTDLKLTAMNASNSPGPTPISKLHDDILWSVFMWNSYMIPYGFSDEGFKVLGAILAAQIAEPALLRNRKTSQVCRRWREIVIASPSIWANAIDLGYLKQKGDRWRNEVLRRTGNAPLSVICIGRYNHTERPRYGAHILPFLLKLLDTEWSRIRTLVIRSDDEVIDDQLRVSVSRPTPNLQNLAISLYKSNVGRNRFLFSNHTQCLQSLIAKDLSIDFSVLSWSSNLRYLKLGLNELDIATPDLLRSLERMPFLEYLHLWSGRSWDRPRLEQNPSMLTTPPFVFRNLKCILITDCQYAMPELISRIIVPPECFLDIVDNTSNNEIDDIATSQDSAYWSCYTSYIKNNIVSITDVIFCIIYHPFEHWDDVYVDDDSEQEDGSSLLGVNLGGPHGQCFRFRSAGAGASPIAFGLARAISLCDLTKVTTLTLHLKPAEMAEIVENDAFDDLVALISQFHSVATLHTDDNTLKFLMHTNILVFNSRDGKNLFSNVVTIFTDAWESGICDFLGVYSAWEGRPGLSVSQIVFREGSKVPCGDPSVLREAGYRGVTVGWKAALDSRFEITFTDEGVLQFVPKYQFSKS